MSKCAQCGATILFGGVREGGMHFCNAKCRSRNGFVNASNALPDDLVNETLLDLHGGVCPHCKGPGPVDVYRGHRVYSMLVMTSWSSAPRVCCRSCGRKHQLSSLAICGVLGWWGLPWGLVVTPIQIIRNIIELTQPPNVALPSVELERMVRMQLAAAMAQQVRGHAPVTSTAPNSELNAPAANARSAG